MTWQDYNKHYESVIGPLRARERDFLTCTVGYGQMALRSALLLNGGGLLAIPAFAEIIGDIWAKGVCPVALSLGAFVLGLTVAAISIALSFFVFLAAQENVGHEIARQATWITNKYTAVQQGTPLPSLPSASSEETASLRRTQILQGIAIGLGLLSLFAFVVGTLVGLWIILGTPPD